MRRDGSSRLDLKEALAELSHRSCEVYLGRYIERWA
jgi:hypothetical protein